MKRNSIEISVPEPCDQSWGDMQPVNDGRYCQQCSRTLTDFSQMTDRELVNFFHKNNGKVCGRFSRQQLNKPIPLEVPQPNRSIWNTVGLAFTGLLTSISGMAQNVSGVPAIERVAQGDSSSGFVSLKGTVVDERGEAVIFGNVMIEGRQVRTETDLDGRFSIEGELPMDAVLVVDYVGYESYKISVKDFIDGNKQIVLKGAEQYSEVHVVGYMVPAHKIKAPKQEKVRVVEGQVIDGANGEPLIGASVIVKGTVTGVVTDVTGNFRLPVPLGGEQRSAMLQITYTGYTSQEIVIRAAEIPQMPLTIMMEPDQLAGEIVLLGIVAYNRATYPSTLVQWIKKLTRQNPHKRAQREERRRLRREQRQARKINQTTNIEVSEVDKNTMEQTLAYPWQAEAFPNPFSDQLQLELKTEKAMKIQVRLVDAAGRILWSETRNSDGGTQQWSLNPKDLQLTPGNYYWQIEGEDGQIQVLSLIYAARN